MSARLSRRKVATYVAEQLLAGNTDVLDEVAALLVTQQRQREADLLARDIQAELAARGMLVATVESAHALTDQARQAVLQLLGGASHIELREVVRPELLGGIKITTPTQEMDASVLKKLTDLRTRHV